MLTPYSMQKKRMTLKELKAYWHDNPNPDPEFEKWWNETKPKSKLLSEAIERDARAFVQGKKR